MKECQFCGTEFATGEGVPQTEFECCCSEECYEKFKMGG